MVITSFTCSPGTKLNLKLYISLATAIFNSNIASLFPTLLVEVIVVNLKQFSEKIASRFTTITSIVFTTSLDHIQKDRMQSSSVSSPRPLPSTSLVEIPLDFHIFQDSYSHPSNSSTLLSIEIRSGDHFAYSFEDLVTKDLSISNCRSSYARNGWFDSQGFINDTFNVSKFVHVIIIDRILISAYFHEFVACFVLYFRKQTCFIDNP